MGTNHKNCENSSEKGPTPSERKDGNRAFCSKEGKGKRLRKKMKYQLVEYHSLPAYLRDNEFIVGHYRSEWPLKQIFLSIFTIHDETLNVLGVRAMKVPKVVDLHSPQHLPDMLKKADLDKIHSELVAHLPSMPNMANLHRLG